nr:hypothetical protein [Tanacetum cinerariifolium]
MFAETYNLIAFLEKPPKSEGFDQIVDFLNANPVKYALIVSPTIYTSYIKQFWTFVKIKTINEDVWLQALVDGKKDIVNEASIRCNLRLDDAEGTTYLPNAAIFEELRRMGAKTTSWNKFSSTMASAIICLANNQKFNFSKYIFESMLKNLEAGVTFFMVLSLEQIKTNQAAKTEKLKRRFKEFEGCDTKGEWDQQMATKISDSFVTDKALLSMGGRRRYGVSVSALTKDHKGIKLNMPYPKDQYAVLEIRNKYNILEDIKRGPYSKKSPIRRDLNNSTSNVLIPLDSWKSGLLVYRLPLSAIIYNDAQTSKSDLLTEPILSPQHIDEFNLKDESSLSECDEEEQNVLNFNDLFSFNVIYPNDSKSDKDNDDDKFDMEHSSGNFSVKPVHDVINTDIGAYEHRPIRRIHQGRYDVSVPALTKDHKGIKLNKLYPKDQYIVLEIRNEYNIQEDIKRGPYSKKSQYAESNTRIRRIALTSRPYK